MDDCIFCQIVRGEAPSWPVLASDEAYAFLDINPSTPYHTLVVPRRHARNLFDVTEADLLATTALAKRVVDLYRERLGIENLQLLSCAGAEAQQDVFHLHLHIVPRSAGDGQDVTWATHPEWRDRFDAMIARLAEPE